MAQDDETREPGPDRGSLARTHLSNERTFLSWLRTGVTLIALGLAAAQFLALSIPSGLLVTQTIAVALVITGIFVTLVGRNRYLANRDKIERGEFRPASRSITIATVLLVLVGLVSIAFIVLLRG